MSKARPKMVLVLLVALSLFAVVLFTLSPRSVTATVAGHVQINELDADTAGIDTAEFVELTSDPNTPLDDICLVLFNGDAAGVAYNVYDLMGYSTDANGFFVVNNAVTNESKNWIQNGADGAAVVEKNGGACPVEDTETAQFVCDNYVIDDVLHYGTSDSAAADLACLGTYYDEDENGNKDTDSLQRDGDGTFCASATSEGTANACNVAATAVPTTPAGTVAPTAVASTPIPATGDVVISELDSDTAGTDIGEFIELFGTASNDLGGHCLVLFNGSDTQGGAVYESYDLTGYATDANGYFVFGDTEAGRTAWLQNGADGAAVVEKNSGACPIDGTDTAATVCAGFTLAFGVHYGTDDTASANLSCLGTYVDEDANGNKDNDSLQLQSGAFCASAPTQGTGNVCGVFATAVPTTPSATITPTATATPAPTVLPTGNVAINELDADTAGTDVGEFIELFGTADNNLGGYCLVLFNGNAAGAVYESYDLTGYATDANGYFVFGDTEAGKTAWLQNGADGAAVVEKSGGLCPIDGTDTAATVCAIFAIASSIQHGTADDAIAELACLGTLVDEDANGDKDIESLQLDAAGSLCASAPTAGMANVCAAQPTVMPEATADPAVTPTATPSPVSIDAGTEGLIINEIMANPANLGDGEGEWFEVYNPSSVPFDMNGCVLSDLGANSHTISGTISVPAMGYAVLGNDIISATAPIDYVYSSFQLSNGDDEIIIECAGTVVDAVAYDTAAGWTIPAGSSVQLNATTADNRIAGNWSPATNGWGGSVDFGTPGDVNVTIALPTAITLNSIDANNIVISVLVVTAISTLLLTTVIITKRD